MSATVKNKQTNKCHFSQGGWLAQSVEFVTLDLTIVSWSPIRV